MLLTAVAVGWVAACGDAADTTGTIEPRQRPPAVVQVSSGDAALDPGRAVMAVTLADDPELGFDPTYVLVPGERSAVLLPMTDRVPNAYTRQLSLDGTRLLRDGNNTGRIEIVELRSGKITSVESATAYCPQMASDQRTIAGYDSGTDKLVIIDIRSGDVSPGPQPKKQSEGGYCTGLGWSPDGQALLVPDGDGSFVADRDGRVLHRLPTGNPVNNGMSWSPDATRILVYDKAVTGFAMHDVEEGTDVELPYPPDAIRPVGWAGSRVVWLAGQPGDQRLLTTDLAGAHPRTWTRLDVGGLPVEDVEWSTAYAGAAAG